MLYPNPHVRRRERRQQVRPARHRAHVAGDVEARRRVSRRARSSQEEILHHGDVPLSVGAPAHGPRAQLHHRRRGGARAPHAGRRGAVPDGLGRVRAAGGERGHQGQGASAQPGRCRTSATCASSSCCSASRTTGTREVTTCEPEYFVHEQRIFIEMFKRGLAYRKGGAGQLVPVDQTVLANEQVEDGLCWRCRSVVQQRELEQWFLKVTAYADELLDDAHEQLEGKWPDKVLRMQENWIGRSRGRAHPVSARRTARGDIEVFTTRPDTLYGVTFMSIAAEHPLVKRGDATEARAFAERVPRKTRSSARAEDYDKSGVDTGLRCQASGHRRRDARSMSPTSCSWTTARARSWRCRRTISATSSSPPSTACQ